MIYRFELGVESSVAPFVCTVSCSGDGFAVFDEYASDGDFVRVESFLGLGSWSGGKVGGEENDSPCGGLLASMLGRLDLVRAAGRISGVGISTLVVDAVRLGMRAYRSVHVEWCLASRKVDAKFAANKMRD